jgi:hypothetical protein
MGENKRGSHHPNDSEHLHKEVRASLPEYAAALALMQDPYIRYPEMAAHLESCAGCRAELEELMELVGPAYSGQVEPAGSYPAFDLSFLQAPPIQPAELSKSWFVDELHRLVIVFSDALLAGMRPQALVQAARGQALYRYTPEPAPPDGIMLTIDIFADEANANIGNVQVLIDLPDRDPFDQSGIRVNMWAGDRVWEGMTGETGSAAFGGVPLALLPRLRVEIALS